jgi:hypothetical protein
MIHATILELESLAAQAMSPEVVTRDADPPAEAAVR